MDKNFEIMQKIPDITQNLVRIVEWQLAVWSNLYAIPTTSLCCSNFDS
jgi:hypothetical protein